MTGPIAGPNYSPSVSPYFDSYRMTYEWAETKQPKEASTLSTSRDIPNDPSTYLRSTS